MLIVPRIYLLVKKISLLEYGWLDFKIKRIWGFMRRLSVIICDNSTIYSYLRGVNGREKDYSWLLRTSYLVARVISLVGSIFWSLFVPLDSRNQFLLFTYISLSTFSTHSTHLNMHSSYNPCHLLWRYEYYYWWQAL